MSVLEPRPNPETVEALLDTTWRIAQTETARTDALDRTAATAASFASVLATLTATLGISFVERVDTWWAFMAFLLGLLAFLGAAATAVAALFPREYLSLGIAYLERFSTWSEIGKSPTEVRGAAMRGVIATIAREREANDRKADAIRRSFALIGVGLSFVAVEAATLATKEVFG